eukprot:3360541-Pleurochrysis_carterae.AAC.1
MRGCFVKGAWPDARLVSSKRGCFVKDDARGGCVRRMFGVGGAVGGARREGEKRGFATGTH